MTLGRLADLCSVGLALAGLSLLLLHERTGRIIDAWSACARTGY
jgi:hypothetical protein